jgi:putative tricarboxylic transport membrane protein
LRRDVRDLASVMKINDAVFGVVLLLLGVVVLVHVQSFPRIPGQQYGPGLFPGTIAAGLAICGALLIVSGLRHRAEQPWFVPDAWLRSSRHVAAFAAIVGGIVAYLLLVETIGFLIVSTALLAVWLTVLRVRWTITLVIAPLATLVIWYAFYKLLRVPLPWGVLTPYAF